MCKCYTCATCTYVNGCEQMTTKNIKRLVDEFLTEASTPKDLLVVDLEFVQSTHGSMR